MTLRSAALVTLLVILDQVTKLLISVNLSFGESVPVLKGIFHITCVHNTGVAFGLFKGMVPVFIFLAGVVVFFLFLYTGVAARRG